MRAAVHKHVGTSVLWTTLVSQGIVYLINKAGNAPLDPEGVLLIGGLAPMILRGLEPYGVLLARALRARLAALGNPQ